LLESVADVRIVNEFARRMSFDASGKLELRMSVQGLDAPEPHVGWDVSVELTIVDGDTEVAAMGNTHRVKPAPGVKIDELDLGPAELLPIVWPYIRVALQNAAMRLGLPRPPLPVWVDPALATEQD